MAGAVVLNAVVSGYPDIIFINLEKEERIGLVCEPDKSPLQKGSASPICVFANFNHLFGTLFFLAQGICRRFFAFEINDAHLTC